MVITRQGRGKLCSLERMIDARILADHLDRHYAVRGRLEPIARGRADNYLVSTDAGRWLLKIFQPEFTPERVEQAAAFIAFAVDAGYPARAFAPTVDGPRTTRLDDRAAVLIPWIDGETADWHVVADDHTVGEIGALCGWIHRIGAAWPRASALAYAR